MSTSLNVLRFQRALRTGNPRLAREILDGDLADDARAAVYLPPVGDLRAELAKIADDDADTAQRLSEAIVRWAANGGVFELGV